ncbi:Hist-deacetyl domain-containing protein [Mycena indigotica]|uniref:histone deacetylase n=1 Tax=Mycena indigotica TaxID=2126181 RepID=A0A8H6S4Z1_9AGAR|nr:Hist-deacetyl domain-containing protein [Mycena indigotica]KAF7291897.1 Hist-deacetyl domain-containing protein [Mycena indigotica]
MDDGRPVVAYIASLELMKVSSLLPSNPQRSAVVHTLARSLGLYARDFSSKRALVLVPPQKAEPADLIIYHTREYLDFVLDPDNAEQNSHNAAAKTEYGLEEDCPMFPRVSDYVRLVGGAAITAAKKLQHPRCELAICWDGGRHHAKKERAEGFCYVADCVLALMAMRRMVQPGQRKPRIMYLDLDLHFSDGVSQAFHQTSSTSPHILTFSIHHTAPGFYPTSPLAHLPTPNSDPFTLSLPLQQGASNRTFFRAWRCVELIHTTFDPDLIVLQCGVDSLAGDPCAIFNWSLGPISEEGSLGWCVSRVVNHWRGKKLLLGGGGYDSPNAARAWAYLTSIALGNPLPLDTEIPSDDSHEYFPQYAPSFVLDVPAGTMQDRNTNEYLESVERAFEAAAIAVHTRTK